MRKQLQKAYDAELIRHEKVIAALANKRLKEFVKEWKKVSECSVTLHFGMGTCSIYVDGDVAWEEDFHEINEALQDVEDITDNYRRACPDDVEVEER